MRRIFIPEKEIRSLLRESLGSSEISVHLKDEVPVKVNPVVDPSAPETDPSNQDFLPQNKQELISALRSFFDSEDLENFPDIYITIKDALDARGDKMKKQNVEEAIRAAVRKMLSEAELPPVQKIPPGVHGKEYMQRFEKAKAGLGKVFRGPVGDEEDLEVDDDRTRKNKMMTDVGGATFKQIAKEFGFAAESGAKQAVEKALQKSKFITDLAVFDPDTLEILVLQAMSDYINVLDSSGELTGDEVKLLKSNPAIVRELDGFREFLDKEIRKNRKQAEVKESARSSSLKKVLKGCFSKA